MSSITSDHPPLASGSVTVRTSPDAVYALVTDLDRLAELGEEVHAMRWTAEGGAHPGATFVGRNRNGVRRWTTRCTVTAATPAEVFAFDVHLSALRIPIAHWRFDMSGGAGDTVVTERMWDTRPRWFVGVGGLATGVTDRATVNTAHIETTLARLQAVLDTHRA